MLKKIWRYSPRIFVTLGDNYFGAKAMSFYYHIPESSARKSCSPSCVPTAAPFQHQDTTVHSTYPSGVASRKFGGNQNAWF